MWREWALQNVERCDLGVDDLVALWRTVLDFDPVLAAYSERPIEVDQPVVVVAGSGKETFKTFNVSTAASILAAAAGARVVKGISRSVSAVSGSADVLNDLGIASCHMDPDISASLADAGIAFVPYSMFCPRYAERYDGVFNTLTPLSFFMPTAVLAVRANAFVYGLAHADVDRAASAINATRPDLEKGVVVATQFTSGEYMDEAAPFGTTIVADLRGSTARCARRIAVDPTAEWTSAVRHRTTHRDNARLIVAALDPEPADEQGRNVAELADLNAAQILRACLDLTDEDSLRRVRTARRESRGLALLNRLQTTEGRVLRAG